MNRRTFAVLGLVGTLALGSAAHAWFITTGLNCQNWPAAVRDGHELILKEALDRVANDLGLSAEERNRHAQDICFGVRDNDQDERRMLPFGGAQNRHHSVEAQRTHSMLPGELEYRGPNGFRQAVGEAKAWTVGHLMQGLRGFENLATAASSITPSERGRLDAERSGREVGRDVEGEARGEARVEARYNGLRLLGKALHALQDSYSCAHSHRQGPGGALCELYSYQGTCAPGASKIHATMDQGDNTATCNQKAAAVDATATVLRAFYSARRQLLQDRQKRAEQFQADMQRAVEPSFRMQLGCQPGPQHQTWAAAYQALRRELPAGVDRNLPVLNWRSREVSTVGALSVADRDRLRLEQRLLCGMETGSDRAQQALDTQFPRLEGACDQLPNVALGQGDDAGKVTEYIRENWTCRSEAVLLAWGEALRDHEGLRNAQSRAGQDANALRERVTRLWRERLCPNLPRIREILQRMVNEYRDFERSLERIKNRVAEILHCTGVGAAVEFAQMRAQDVSDAWRRFREEFTRFKARIRAGLHATASRVMDLVPGLRTQLRHAVDWVRLGCLTDEGTFMGRQIRPLLQDVGRFVARVIGPRAEAAYTRMRQAATQVGGLFQRLLSSAPAQRLAQQGQELGRRLGNLYPVFRAMASGGARTIEQALERAGGVICSAAEPVRQRIEGAITWARQTLQRVEQGVQRVGQAAQRAGEAATQTARRAAETARTAFNAVNYGRCLVQACFSSPRQCTSGSGADLNRDVASCDRTHGYSSAAAFDKPRYLSCVTRCCAASPLQCSGARDRSADFTPCVSACGPRGGNSGVAGSGNAPRQPAAQRSGAANRPGQNGSTGQRSGASRAGTSSSR